MFFIKTIMNNRTGKVLPLFMMLFFVITMLAAPASAKPAQASEKQKTEKSEKKKADKKKSDKKKSDKKTDKKSNKKSDKKSDKKNQKKDKSSKKKSGKKVTIQKDDPKAFTKSILYEIDGAEVEFVDLNSMTKKAQKEAKKEAERIAKAEAKEEAKKKAAAAELEAITEVSDDPEDFFDFSTMLIPVTHEAHLGSPYGIRDHRLHRGVDVQVVKEEPMVAAYPGKVIVSRYNKGGYGHYVIVEHENGLQTLYGHLAERTVKVGDQVYPGDIVGLAGNTGKSSGAHLHFEIRYGDVNIDPVTVIDFPHWQLKPGVEKYSKKKAIQAHRKMQSKLKLENIYIVKSGDTVADVAEFFYISEDAVRRINHLAKGEPLRVGQRLKGCQ